MSIIARIAGIFKKDERVELVEPVAVVEDVKEVAKPEEEVKSEALKPERQAPDGPRRLRNFKHGKENYIKGKAGVEVYDTRSKRRIGKEIGKENMIRVFLSDRVVKDGNIYLVESIDDKYVNLKKIGPAE